MDRTQPAPHTVVFSDIHLTTAVPQDPERPLWRRYRHADLFVDDRIDRMLRHVEDGLDGTPLEVVLNGDVFDFDAVTDLPEPPDDPDFDVTALERARGLSPTEDKAAWQMGRILDDHPVFVDTLQRVLAAGHTVVFVIGNHDLPLHWPAVQRLVRDRIDPGARAGRRLRFCAWFYVSGGDTLIEHGHQYDTYCLTADPLWPAIRLGADDIRTRMPFGNYAARMLINGMGMINPYVSAAFLMPFTGFVVFFWRHILRVQPLVPLVWAWSSLAALYLTLRDGFAPAHKDVLGMEDRVEQVAADANATPRTVRGLHALRVHPAFLRPWKVAKELWLDRLFLFVLAVFGTLQLLATLNLFWVVSTWWWFALLAIVFPPFLFYANGVRSDVHELQDVIHKRLDLIAAVAGVNRVVLGHTHHALHHEVGSVELLNPGTWSPSFADVACTERVGQTAVVHLRPAPDGGPRQGTVEAWVDPGFEPIARERFTTAGAPEVRPEERALV